MEMAISSSPYHLKTTPSIARRSVSSSPPSLSLRSSFLSSVKNLSAVPPNCRASQRSRKVGLSCKCLFGLGVPELVVIAGVVALVFGPKKLPEVGRSIGKTVKSFQQAAKEFETELKKEPDSTTEAIENTTVVRQEENGDLKEPSTKET